MVVQARIEILVFGNDNFFLVVLSAHELLYYRDYVDRPFHVELRIIVVDLLVGARVSILFGLVIQVDL